MSKRFSQNLFVYVLYWIFRTFVKQCMFYYFYALVVYLLYLSSTLLVTSLLFWCFTILVTAIPICHYRNQVGFLSISVVQWWNAFCNDRYERVYQIMKLCKLYLLTGPRDNCSIRTDILAPKLYLHLFGRRKFRIPDKCLEFLDFQATISQWLCRTSLAQMCPDLLAIQLHSVKMHHIIWCNQMMLIKFVVENKLSK